MNIIKAYDAAPKGRYVCTYCGKEYILDRKSILTVCECGNEEFRADIIIELKKDEIEEKFAECIEVLAISTYLFDEIKIASFLNVIALNLRMLLCDGENPLLLKVLNDPMFPACSKRYEEGVLSPKELFYNLNGMLDLDEFLNQILIYPENSRPLNVKKMIKAIANKQGGAHLDTELEADYFLCASSAKYYLHRIALYIIEISGYDYRRIIKDFKDRIDEKNI